MTTITQPTPNTLAWLGDGLMQCSVLLAGALIANLLLRKGAAAWRHAILLAAVFSVPLLFVLSALLPAWKLPNSAPLSASFEPTGAGHLVVTSEIVVGAPLPTGDLAPSPVANGPDPNAEGAPLPNEVGGVSQEAGAQGFASWPIALWLAGTLAIWLRLGCGIAALARYRETADNGVPQRVRSLVATEAERLGVDAPAVLMLGEDTMPMTWWVRRHFLALPNAAVGWSEATLRRVLRHEIAHMRRRDCLTSWLADASLALIWFHPLAWLSRGALVQARETACDDLALGDSGNSRSARDSYARDLLDIISTHARGRRQRGTALALAMASPRHSIRRRLDAILDPGRDRRPVPRGIGMKAVPIWLGGLAALASIAACRDPENGRGDVRADLAGAITQEYVLTRPQQRFLGLRVPPGSGFVADDPFAEPSTPTPVEELTLEGSEAASAVRESLRQYGIEIDSDSPARFELKDSYTLAVTANPELQSRIKTALDEQVANRQVKLRMHVYEVADAKWLAELIGAETQAGQYTGIVSRNRMEEIQAELAKGEAELRDLPSVVTRFGQRAKVESIREFIYPTEYDPPEIPQNLDNDFEGDQAFAFPVTPANPTAFDMRPVGIQWEVEPTPRANGAITLNMTVDQTRFMGLVNYGSPIQAMAKTAFGKPVSVVLTENRIEQPVFHTHRMSTEVEIPPGHVLAISGFAPADALVMDLVTTAGTEQSVNSRTGIEKPKSVLFLVEATLIENP